MFTNENRKDFPRVGAENGSSDGSEERLRLDYPRTILQAGQNLGLARGSNLGIRNALEQGADHVFLPHNDTIVWKEVVCEVVDFLESDAVASLARGKVFLTDPAGRHGRL